MSKEARRSSPSLFGIAAVLADKSFRQQVQRFAASVRPKLSGMRRESHRTWRAAAFDRRSIEALDGIVFGWLESGAGRTFAKTFDVNVRKHIDEMLGAGIEPRRITQTIQRSEPLFRSASAGEEAMEKTHARFFAALLLTVQDALAESREKDLALFAALTERDGHTPDELLRKFVETAAGFMSTDTGDLYLLTEDLGTFALHFSTSGPSNRETRIAVANNAAALNDFSRARGSRTAFSLPLRRNGTLIGILLLGFQSARKFTKREEKMLSAIGISCADIAAQSLTKQLTYRLLQAEEAERRRISRELHDSSAQSLAVIRLQLELLEMDLPAESAEREKLLEARTVTESAILEIRRLIFDLSPAVLEQLGLSAALRQLLNRFRATYPCKAELKLDEHPPIGRELEVLLYRIAQECLLEITKNASSKRVSIALTASETTLSLTIEGDEEDCERAQLLGLRERVLLLGGVLQCKIRHYPKKNKRYPRVTTTIKVDFPLKDNQIG